MSTVNVITFVGRGNVGKSLTVEMIGRALVKQGQKVIIIDMDGQANLSRKAVGSPIYNLCDVLTGRAGLFEAMTEFADSGAYIVPSCPNLEEVKADAVRNPMRLAEAVQTADNAIVLIDTPGAFDEFGQMAVLASTLVVGVTNTNMESFERAKAIARQVNELAAAGYDARFYGYVLTYTGGQSTLRREAVEHIQSNGHVLAEVKEDNSKRRMTYFRKVYGGIAELLV